MISAVLDVSLKMGHNDDKTSKVFAARCYA